MSGFQDGWDAAVQMCMEADAQRQASVKKVMQALLIADDMYMRAAIRAGKKKISIREGHRDYEAGRQMMICDHVKPWAVLVDITEMRHCQLANVTREEWEADGFASKGDLLHGMRKYYPSMDYSSLVTVVKWDNARGALVDGER